MSEVSLRGAAELHEAAAEMLKAGDHEGPCLNYPGQNPEDAEFYDDTCYLHIAAYRRRKAALTAVLNRCRVCGHQR